MQESRIQSLGQKDSPGEGNSYIHSSILAWDIPWTKAPGGPQSIGSPRLGHSWTANTHTGTCALVFSTDTENSLKKDAPRSLCTESCKTAVNHQPVQKAFQSVILNDEQTPRIMGLLCRVSETTAKNSLNGWTWDSKDIKFKHGKTILSPEGGEKIIVSIIQKHDAPFRDAPAVHSVLCSLFSALFVTQIISFFHVWFYLHDLWG